MSTKYLDSVGTKLDPYQRQRWAWLCEYRGVKSAEYIRRLISEEIDRHSKDKDWKVWVKVKGKERNKEE